MKSPASLGVCFPRESASQTEFHLHGIKRERGPSVIYVLRTDVHTRNCPRSVSIPVRDFGYSEIAGLRHLTKSESYPYASFLVTFLQRTGGLVTLYTS